ncbi:Fatty acid oxidation complex subunit alpha [Thalassovita gelatinovora]|uniref:Fatty acid oxidation complex subunit alpha n=1 Tax=Thalassovita gelatinovora TaxID=53501 RepID=A0A0P1FGH2_THAGE|nr:3-hydroxyacyl-CoA dehydrogenase NAD-binding domain-containing protein [Thalassovita gelatinovora]QIZ79890.1 hypothetical protein HFZ77_05030 [Thalassovita gelatinovora]CUH67003.1 Fatty acid oxidation complex subunit alpha [Thalassovita gelatinovora]SEQ46812.1 3-hydroxyacyl-CoA dehydrogenase [Thalassovita gelatinovora]
MTKLVQTEQQDGVAIVTLHNGPVNILSRNLRVALIERIAECAADTSVRAIVLRGAGTVFSSGLDLGELESKAEQPDLAALCSAVEDCTKPVVAALSGLVLGGAAELALAAHARVADKTVRIGFPSFAMGLLPSAGATQRLPRLIGAEHSLMLIRAGHPFPIDAEGVADLVDRTEPEASVEAAITEARRLADHPDQMQRGRDRVDGFADPAAFQAAVSKLRHQMQGRYAPTEAKLIDCVEASMLLPFEAGLAFEQAAAEDCRQSAYSRGLRHAHQAQRRASNFPERLQADPRKIESVGIIGGGVSATGIAALAVLKQHKVVLFERTEEAAAEALSRIKATLRALGAGDRLDDLLGHLTTTVDLRQMSGADMLIEAVAENPTTKAQVFAALDQVARDDAILVSNSALLSIDEIAAATKRPAQVIGMHFHAPVQMTTLAEVIPGAANTAETIVTAADFAAGLGRVVVRCGTGGGTLGEPMLMTLRDAAIFQLQQGISPYDIDRALIDFGLPNGVFKAIDRLGLDVVVKRMHLLHGIKPQSGAIDDLLQRMIAAGYSGQRDGKGFYRWDDHMAAHPDPDIGAVLGRDLNRIRPGGADLAQIQLNCLAALANQGAKLLRSDAALRPSDIDAVMVLGHGFPRYQGGPMKAADMAGLFHILQELRRCTDALPALYAPEPGIAALVRNGEDFDALNRLGRNRRTIPE